MMENIIPSTFVGMERDGRSYWLAIVTVVACRTDVPGGLPGPTPSLFFPVSCQTVWETYKWRLESQKWFTRCFSIIYYVNQHPIIWVIVVCHILHSVLQVNFTQLLKLAATYGCFISLYPLFELTVNKISYSLRIARS